MGVVVPIDGGKEAKASVTPLVDLTSADMALVNQLILSKTGSDVTMIPEVAQHLIDSGGKRLRPMLTIAAARMCGYGDDATGTKGLEHHITLAASVEFMHTATLLHDDVVDESDMRRGKQSARIVWGNQASVLVGDFLLGQAFRMMVDAGSMDALDVLSTAPTVSAEGEVMQLAAAQSMETTEDDYLAVIRGKTAALFSAACEVGPILAGSEKPVRDAFRSYGMNLGLAFQLIDDALDYGGSKADLGKNVGDDFHEGKITLPVLLAYRRGNAEEQEFWRKAMEGDSADEQALAEAMELLAKHGAIPATVARARHYGEMARDALAPLPAGSYKDALLEVVEFCVSRVS